MTPQSRRLVIIAIQTALSASFLAAGHHWIALGFGVVACALGTLSVLF